MARVSWVSLAIWLNAKSERFSATVGARVRVSVRVSALACGEANSNAPKHGLGAFGPGADIWAHGSGVACAEQGLRVLGRPLSLHLSFF